MGLNWPLISALPNNRQKSQVPIYNTLQDKDTIHYKTKTVQDTLEMCQVRLSHPLRKEQNIQYTTEKKEPGGIFSGFLSSVTDEQMPHGSSISAHFPALQNLPRSHRKYLHTLPSNIPSIPHTFPIFLQLVWSLPLSSTIITIIITTTIIITFIITITITITITTMTLSTWIEFRKHWV